MILIWYHALSLFLDYDILVERTRYRCYFVHILTNVVIKSTLSLAAVYLQKILDVEASWKISSAGEVKATLSVKKDKEFPELPRFGVRLFLKKEYIDVSYYGMGLHLYLMCQNTHKQN